MYAVRYCFGDGWGWARVSCVLGMFMVRASSLKAVSIGGDARVWYTWVMGYKLG